MIRASYLCLLLAGGRVSADGNSQFESLWNTAAAAVFNAIDAYGWVVPALVISLLFLGLAGSSDGRGRGGAERESAQPEKSEEDQRWKGLLAG
jgi:hypothetical protein